MTGERLRAFDCLYVGLATHYLPSESGASLLGAIVELKDNSGDISEIENLLKDLRGSADPPNHEAFVIVQHEEAIVKCFSGERLEDVLSALENYSDNKEWAQKTLDTLSRMSPLSLKVTF